MKSDAIPTEGGMLDLSDCWRAKQSGEQRGGVARCCAAECGWVGTPTYVDGEAQTECPKCEGWSSEFGEEPDLRERPLAYDVHLPVRVPKRRENIVKIGRNDPCPCGSGKKFKKCCG